MQKNGVYMCMYVIYMNIVHTYGSCKSYRS